MSRYRVTRTAVIHADRARIYNVIADYREHHPRIVPPQYFPKLEVTAGGVGAGTRTRVEMRVLGATRVFEQAVTEPEPGRVLMEAGTDGSSTTFTVDDADGRGSSRVTIATELEARPGLAGRVERWMTSIMLRRIYRLELAQLARYVTGGGSNG
jgi:polyketide cyclase/dehydrase/lipid transport protein